MGKYGFDGFNEEDDYYDDEDEETYDEEEDNFDDDEDEDDDAKDDDDEVEAEIETYVCEDCRYRWEVEASEEEDLLDYYNGDRSGSVCPMCGSFSVYAEEK
jgi:hypothetical protein